MRIATVIVVAIALGLCLASTVAAQGFSSVIDGFQVVPPVFTPASGIGGFNLDERKMLEYNISYGGLTGTETCAHVCGPAFPGDNAPVIFDLPAGPVKFGTFGPLTAQQEADLTAGLWYVLVCSTAYPEGEIRGQILSSVPVEEQTWGAIKELYRAQ
jgi:hypothetical protein